MVMVNVTRIVQWKTSFKKCYHWCQFPSSSMELMPLMRLMPLMTSTLFMEPFNVQRDEILLFSFRVYWVRLDLPMLRLSLRWTLEWLRHLYNLHSITYVISYQRVMLNISQLHESYRKIKSRLSLCYIGSSQNTVWYLVKNFFPISFC